MEIHLFILDVRLEFLHVGDEVFTDYVFEVTFARLFDVVIRLVGACSGPCLRKEVLIQGLLYIDAVVLADCHPLDI